MPKPRPVPTGDFTPRSSQGQARLVVDYDGTARARMEIETGLTDELRNFLNACVRTAKARVHVRTGRLKRSIRTYYLTEQNGQVQGVVVATAPYAQFEEARGGAHAFLQPSIDVNLPVFEQRMRDRMRRLGQ